MELSILIPLNKMNNKSQTWSLDLIIAVVIFSVGIIIVYVYSINHPLEAKENFDDLFSQGNNILESILSEGYPLDWDSSSVTKIGVLDNYN